MWRYKRDCSHWQKASSIGQRWSLAGHLADKGAITCEIFVFSPCRLVAFQPANSSALLNFIVQTISPPYRHLLAIACAHCLALYAHVHISLVHRLSKLCFLHAIDTSSILQSCASHPATALLQPSTLSSHLLFSTIKTHSTDHPSSLQPFLHSLVFASSSHIHPLTMAFVSPLSIPPSRKPSAPVCSRPRMTATPSNRPPAKTKLDSVNKSTVRTQIYGPNEDICTYGEECNLTDDCVTSSPALECVTSKYVFPMREENTQVFFDNSIHPDQTLLIVFARDRHGFVLDVVSVLKALSIRVHRVASSESDALRLVMSRIEGELVSLAGLGLSLHNCLALWISDEETGDKIFDDGQRLDQISQCIKLELVTPYPRPKARDHSSAWHRVSVQKDRAGRYTVFTVQTADFPGLLAALSKAFNGVQIDVASASIETFSTRVENHFFVTKRGFKQPLEMDDIMLALDRVMQALLKVGNPSDHETLWYQMRDGTALLVAEAIFIDEVNNRELACFRFSQFETPNFRGRLPEAPYKPIFLS